jgi:hypothetical protein
MLKSSFILPNKFFHVWIAALILLLSVSVSNAQKLWDGEAGDGEWNNPLNWSDNIIPATGDDVVLDNSVLAGNYNVNFPAGTISIQVQSLLIDPASGNRIELQLPATNTANPGFIVNGLLHSMIIKQGGVFINASGASSGNPFVLEDSLKIENGGRYIHRTVRAHSTIVNVLSRAPGTEEGIFEFDIPDASTTISVSDRVYGKLVLSAFAAGGLLNYTAAGTRKVTVKTDFEINPGVRLNLNCSDTLFIGRDYIQHGGIVNLSSLTRRLILSVNGRLTQHPSGVITETGSASADIVLQGQAQQAVNIAGIIQNSVAFKLNNTGGAILESPLQLPSSLVLSNGKIITSSTSVLSLLPACNVVADSLGNSFIDGPMQKLGLATTAYFLFPVGDGNQLRWLELKNATGDFIVEYNKGNPRTIGNGISGIDHISALEYWTIDASASSTASVELSFADANGSGVTDMITLRVAILANNEWINGGNLGTTGSAGSRGSVLSEQITSFNPAGTTYFTLASSVGNENPLPTVLLGFSATSNGNSTLVKWQIDNDFSPLYFELQESFDSIHYTVLKRTEFVPGKFVYSANIPVSNTLRYLRLRMVGSADREWISQVLFIKKNGLKDLSIELFSLPIGSGQLRFRLYSQESRRMRFVLIDASGRLVKIFTINVEKGHSNIEFFVPRLPHVLYQFFGLSSTGRTNTLRFFK